MFNWLSKLKKTAIENVTAENTFVPFTFNGKQIFVMRDYYMADGIRMPLSYNEAMRVASANGWRLPTRELVDAIWRQADLKLEPITTTPDAGMVTHARFVTHNDLINKQINGRSYNLVAGHKKDVIAGGRGFVTIYGWHRANGRPIQNPYSGHDDNYKDYSHGIRFIKD